MENENNETNMFASDNGAYNTASVLALRLDTTPILKDWELYLKGEYLVEEITKEGDILIKSVSYAQPKANERGIYSIMSWLKAKLNPQIVQGNLENFEALDRYLEHFRMNFAEYLMINIYQFQISEFEFEGIVDNILDTCELFLSRLVKDKERESYNHTIQHTQKSDTVMNSKSRVPFM